MGDMQKIPINCNKNYSSVKIFVVLRSNILHVNIKLKIQREDILIFQTNCIISSNFMKLIRWEFDAMNNSEFRMLQFLRIKIQESSKLSSSVWHLDCHLRSVPCFITLMEQVFSNCKLEKIAPPSQQHATKGNVLPHNT